MRNYCSTELTYECQTWHNTTITALVVIAMVIIAMHFSGFGNWSLFTDAIIIAGAVVSGLWALWVVRTIRGILSWWKNMHSMLDVTHDLLQETKQDIKEIKDLQKPPQ